MVFIYNHVLLYGCKHYDVATAIFGRLLTSNNWLLP
uniref:Uncharacterized protein n=1 Tax=Anguilla anguilla TaxID=7936 RepID=A0A0E9W2A2_ANGAN